MKNSIWWKKVIHRAGATSLLLLLLVPVYGFYQLFSLLSPPQIPWIYTGMILYFMNIADFWSTKLALDSGAEEANPIFCLLFKFLGFRNSFLITQLCLIFIVIFVIWPKIITYQQYALLAVYPMVIINNFALAKILKRRKASGTVS